MQTLKIEELKLSCGIDVKHKDNILVIVLTEIPGQPIDSEQQFNTVAGLLYEQCFKHYSLEDIHWIWHKPAVNLGCYPKFLDIKLTCWYEATKRLIRTLTKKPCDDRILACVLS